MSVGDVCMYVYVCTCVGHFWCYSLGAPPPPLLKQSLSLGPWAYQLIRLGWLDSDPLGFYVSASPTPSVYHHAWLFYMGSGD